jgi:hypothetical protein
MARSAAFRRCMRGGELEIGVLFIHKELECVRGFIVEALKERFEASRFEQSDCRLVGSDDGGACAVGYWGTVDVVAVIIVYDEYVLVA